VLGEFFGLPVDTLWEIVTSALVPAGTLDTLSALNVPGCPKASGGLTRSLWAEMVFPDASINTNSYAHCSLLTTFEEGPSHQQGEACQLKLYDCWNLLIHGGINEFLAA